MENLKSIVEAIIFASDIPLNLKQIKEIISDRKIQEQNGRTQITEEDIKKAIDELNNEYAQRGSAFKIIEIAEGYQFATLPEFAKWVSRLYAERNKKKLSQAGLETLAIIAYKQPISKPEIEEIRGVNVDHVIKSLLERKLITIVGRAETIGRPLLYGTTKEFLKYFGLRSLSDLPKPNEIEEITKPDSEVIQDEEKDDRKKQGRI